MKDFRAGAIWIPFMVLIMLLGAFSFSRKLDKEVERYAKKVRLENEHYKEMSSLQWDREFDCRLGESFSRNK